VHYKPTESCLWVIDPSYDRHNPDLPELTRQMIAISNLQQIVPQPLGEGYPPQDIFGPEPSHTWCYYYQKADLARQLGDWERVVSLGDTARSKGYHPQVPGSNTPPEWRPFILGYAHLGRWDVAAELTTAAAARSDRYTPMLCWLWRDIQEQMTPGPELDEAASIVRIQLDCK
ncbi:MAG: hypothetical protein U1B80_08135, partial [Anaerolineaceae bacterium]|nr:hypothetical protein [Anaerolineaceae bacterium]